MTSQVRPRPGTGYRLPTGPCAGVANVADPLGGSYMVEALTDGLERAPARAMLRAVGFGDGDFDKPIVGVANGHSTSLIRTTQIPAIPRTTRSADAFDQRAQDNEVDIAVDEARRRRRGRRV